MKVLLRGKATPSPTWLSGPTCDYLNGLNYDGVIKRGINAESNSVTRLGLRTIPNSDDYFKGEQRRARLDYQVQPAIALINYSVNSVT